MVGTGRGAQLGLLIKGPEILESTRRVDTIVLDKTGTVTTGRMSLAGIAAAAGTDPDEALRLAGALEAASEHPIGRAIAAAAADRLGPLPGVEGFANREGLGVEGTVEGRRLVAGRPGLLAERGLALGAELDDARRAAEARGQTAIAVAWDGEARAVLAVADAVKESSAEAVAQLKALGLRPVLLTGDNETTAAAVAREWASTRSSRGAAVRQGRRRPAAAGRGPRRGDGGGRGQRRARAGAGRPRARHRHRDRRRHRGLGPHARLRTCAPRRTRSASRARRCARSSRTSAGRSATTSPACRSPRSAC